MLLLAFPQLFRRATAMVILAQAAWMTAAEDIRADDFAANQTQRRRQLWSLLGDLPRNHQPAAPTLRKKEHVEVKGGVGYTVEHLLLDLNGLEPVPAILLIPDERAPKAPGMLYLHWHGSDYAGGKHELLIGNKGLQSPYAPVARLKRHCDARHR